MRSFLNQSDSIFLIFHHPRRGWIVSATITHRYVIVRRRTVQGRELQRRAWTRTQTERGVSAVALPGIRVPYSGRGAKGDRSLRGAHAEGRRMGHTLTTELSFLGKFKVDAFQSARLWL